MSRLDVTTDCTDCESRIRANVIDEIIKIAIAEIDFESREEQHRFVGFMKQLKENK